MAALDKMLPHFALRKLGSGSLCVCVYLLSSDFHTTVQKHAGKYEKQFRPKEHLIQPC